MIRKGILIGILILGSTVLSKSLKSQDIAPQIWNNASVAWVIDDHFSWRNTVAYNVLASSEFPWSEITLMSTGAYRFADYFEATAGVYAATTKQSLSLNSFELRPFIGFRASTNIKKRWLLSNLSRFEMRYLIYSDNSANSVSFRFRNRTNASVSLTKKTMSTNDNNLFVFGYFEAFFNFGQEVRERFFTQFKYKLGFGYRFNFHWGLDIGILYQDATNNVVEPVNLPTTLTTNYIFEWGVRFIIGSNEN